MLANDSIRCKNPGHCPNHPVKHEPPQALELHIDTAQATEVSIDTVEAFVEQPKKVKVLTAFDTISVNNVSLFHEPTYTPVLIHNVSKKPEIVEPMQYDILINAGLFTFMLGLTAKYVVSCGGAWLNLFNELKKEIAA